VACRAPPIQESSVSLSERPVFSQEKPPFASEGIGPLLEIAMNSESRLSENFSDFQNDFPILFAHSRAKTEKNIFSAKGAPFRTDTHTRKRMFRFPKMIFDRNS